MNNFWLKLNKSRKIAYYLQAKYFDKPYGKVTDPLEFKILEDLWNHPLYASDMILNIIWSDDDRLLWLQVGLKQNLVPR
jgi:hypothetical protein